ncbi:MAG: hypothetical protein JW864_06395 [Spirochaetes bacterium]|nr:hypothetical protein [Spirochaetota bacterium]
MKIKITVITSIIISSLFLNINCRIDKNENGASSTVTPPAPLLEVQIESTRYEHDSPAFHFDQQETGDSPQTVVMEIYNNGSLDLEVSNISVSDSTNFVFNGLPALPQTIEPSSKIKFDLTFQPQTTGIFTPAITINNNSEQSEYKINLQGVCADSFKLNLNFDGKENVLPDFAYVCWLEDTSGTNFQNIYVCDKAAPPDTADLDGDALPNWSTIAYYENTDVDGITGASEQDELSVQRQIKDQSIRQFRVLFEIDRSLNLNTYFNDRPAFLYQSELIDLDNIQSSYSFTLIGWMCNGTDSGPYSQAPLDLTLFPDDFSAYIFMTDLKYIEPVDDMINSIAVSITAE